MPSAIYRVQFTIYEARFGRDGEDGKRWWLHHIIYITTRERKNEKTTKLFKIMEMEKFYVAPEVEVLEVAVEKGFEGSAQIPDMGEGDSGDAI